MTIKGAKPCYRTARGSESVSVNFANGQTASTEVVNISEGSIFGIIAPSGLNGVTLTFQVSATATGTFSALAGFSAITLATGANSLSDAQNIALAPYPFAKLVLGTAASGAQACTFFIKN